MCDNTSFKENEKFLMVYSNHYKKFYLKFLYGKFGQIP